MSAKNPQNNGILPQEYLNEHGELYQSVKEVTDLIERANQVILDVKKEREGLAKERAASQEKIQTLAQKTDLLTESLNLQHAKKEARIEEHKKHHAAMMAELQKAKDKLKELLSPT